MAAMDTIKKYYRMTKPGIVYGNLLAAIGAFLFASKGDVDPVLFFAVIGGTALIIASGCVFNNYIDRDIDAKMERTRKRALASGAASKKAALTYGSVLGVLGFLLLILFTNPLAVAVGAIGLSFYVVVYGIAKRASTLGTVVGSIPGATPPLAGYVTVTGGLDAAAILLFLIMAIWQMPHFYAIALMRLKDYVAAGLPVLPAVKGVRTTKLYIMLYIIAFLITAPLLTLLGYSGFIYLIAMGVVGLAWFWKGVDSFANPDNTVWARKMFKFSLIVLLTFSVTLALDPWLP